MAGKEMRATYCETLTRMMKEDERIVVLGADLMSASGTKNLAGQFPDRVFNVGVAESSLVGTAAGMANMGKIPFADTFAAFASCRAYDQNRVSVAYAGMNAKLVGTDPGVASEYNGGTHMALEDVGIMRTIAGMTVVEPCDNNQLAAALPVLASHDGPVYLRLYRRAPHEIYDVDYQFELGKADMLRTGKDVCIVASGMTVYNALEAAKTLAEEGIEATVLNVHTIKPFDTETVVEQAKASGAVVSVENSNYCTGLGSAVATALCENDAFVPFKRLGIQDHFGEVGTADYLMEKFHIAPKDVVEAAKEVIARK